MAELVKQSLENLINGIKQDPKNAAGVFEVTSVLGEGVSVSNAARQFTFKVDEPEVLGGKDQAPNPVEYALASLGACQAITYRAVAALKDIQLDSVTVKTKGELDLRGFLGIDNEIRPGYQKITFEAIVESEESTEKLERLAAQVEALCPVLDMLSNPVPVEGKLTVKKKTALAE